MGSLAVFGRLLLVHDLVNVKRTAVGIPERLFLSGWMLILTNGYKGVHLSKVWLNGEVSLSG